MTKTELAGLLRDEQRQWLALLDEIGPQRMEQPGVNGHWSMKDLVAHVTGWNRKLAADMQAAQRGEPDPLPPWPPHLAAEDDINAWIYEHNRARPLQDVLEASQQAFQDIMAVVESLPDDIAIEHLEPAYDLLWVGGKRFWPGEGFGHFHDEHEANVRVWLARQEKP